MEGRTVGAALRGRPRLETQLIANGAVQTTGGHGGPPLQYVLASCRALNGACGATMVGGGVHEIMPRRNDGWRNGATPGPLMNETLRQLAKEAR